MSNAIVADPLTFRLGPGTRQTDLDRARTLLAATAVAPDKAPAPSPEREIAFVRNPLAAAPTNPLGDPAAVRGMQVSEELGPFIDHNGVSHFVIVLPITASRSFAFDGAASPFAVLPVEGSPVSATTLTLGAGSVWFETHLLVPSVAAGSFSGFRISGGTLTASAPVTLVGTTFVAPIGATLTLTATLAPPATGSGMPGGDLTDATIDLPASITLVFTQNAANVEALGNASLRLYGSTVDLTWNKAAPQALAGFPAILFPFTANVAAFGFTQVSSRIFEPTGSARINAAGWSLPIAVTTIAALGEASGAGSLVLELGAGAFLNCAVRQGRAGIGGWLVGLDPAQLIVVAGGTGPASRTAHTLWPQRPPGRLHSTIDWVNPAGFLASLLATPGHELLALGGSANAFLDRPVAADGGALPISGNGSLFLAVDAAKTTLSILVAPAAPPTERFSLALENALLGVHAPRLLLATGPIASPAATSFENATVTVVLDALWLLPILPDPYAASFEAGPLIDRAAIGLLGVTLTWPGATNVALAIAVTPAPANAPPAPVPAPQTPILPNEPLALLDLSTRADLFGVLIEGPSDAGLPKPRDTGFVDLSLAMSDAAIASFALPQLSWEPMVNEGGPPGAIAAFPATDGVPTRIEAPGVDTQTLVPVAPEPVLLRLIGNVAAGASFRAQFSLPFGMIANISQANRPPVDHNPPLFTQEGGVFALVQPSFAAGIGALQLTLKPPCPTATNARFGGSTTLSTAGPPPGYGAEVLGPSLAEGDVANIFTQEFANNGGVPVRRADLAGYGASIWSEWIEPNAHGPAIIKVQFETVVGRTAYEVIKAQSTVYPNGARMVRTITIARQNAGWVQRTDSGWKQAKPGIFQFPNPQFDPPSQPSRVHRGAVAGVFNLHNVREFESVAAGGFTYRRILYDADIGLDHRVKVTAGGNPSSLTDASGNLVTLIPARDLTGYLQIAPVGVDPGPNDLAQLIAAVGPVTDSFACIAEIGGTPTAPGTALRCAAISVAMTQGGSPQLGAALLSSPVLPRDGAWGFGKRGATATAPTALPRGAPVPLVQANSDPLTWHFADIADVLQLANPTNFYGLLQDTGTQKTLFERPTVKDLSGGAPPGTVPSIQLPAGVAPALADLGSLLGATGIFPDIAKTISFLNGAVEQLQTIPQGLHYTKKISFHGTEQPTTLLDLSGVLRIELIYADTGAGKTASGGWNKPATISFNIDPAHTLSDSKGRNWWLTIGPISFAVTILEFGSDPLLTIVGGFAADDRSKPGLTGLNIEYGKALDTLKTIFSKLQALASFLPGGLGAGLDVSLSNGRLTVRDTFAVPQLPLGLGNLSDVSLDLGLALTLSPLSADFIIGIGDPGKPFNWVVSPLAGNGAIDIGVKGSKRDLSIQAGIGLGLSIDVGIAEGSASVTLGFSIEVSGSAITVMIILNGRASVDVLDGVASASLTLTAAIGVKIDPPPVPVPVLSPPSIEFPAETITFLASVAVGIHISICWVVSVNFEGSWHFSQSVHTPQLTVHV